MDLKKTKKWVAFFLTISLIFGSQSIGVASDVRENEETAEETVADTTIETEPETVADTTAETEPETAADFSLVETTDDTVSEQEETQTEPLPTDPGQLHIGQKKEGEALSDSEQEEPAYDQPVSLEPSASVILYVKDCPDPTPEDEKEGTLVWKVLRGQKDAAEDAEPQENRGKRPGENKASRTGRRHASPYSSGGSVSVQLKKPAGKKQEGSLKVPLQEWQEEPPEPTIVVRDRPEKKKTNTRK